MNLFRSRNRPTSSAPTQRLIFFGDNLPESAATSHFFICGVPGSGKTLTITMLMNSTLPTIKEPGADYRAVIFDVKQDMRSTLSKIDVPSEDIILFNPFDARCHEWDIAKDIDAPDTALQLATILIPEDQSQNRYFTDAARDLLGGVVNAYISLGKEKQAAKKGEPAWRLSDVILAFRSPARLRHVLSQTLVGQELLEMHMGTGDTSLNVLSTARTRLAPFEVVAALWKRAGDGFTNGARGAGRKLALQDFLSQNQILILGNNQSALAPIQALNRIVFQRLTELVLDYPENPSDGSGRRVWFFLDEARKMGKLDGLDDLMNNGRSKGACVVLGFQDIDGMKEVYGPHVAGELTTICANIGFTKLSGVSTPQWASASLGEVEKIVEMQNISQSSGAQGYSVTQASNEQIHSAPLYLPAELVGIPRPEKGKPLVGFFRSPFYFFEDAANCGVKRILSPEELTQRLPSKKGAPVADFEAWQDKSFKYLPDWESEDYQRLHLSPLVHVVPQSPPAAGGGSAVGGNAASGSAAPAAAQNSGNQNPSATFITPQNQRLKRTK